jgi:hypothetical protein
MRELSKKFLLDFEKHAFVFLALNSERIFYINVVSLIFPGFQRLPLVEHTVDLALRV